MDCSICYESITKDTGKAELSCSHAFHISCLSKWFSKNENCPCCRHKANLTETMNQKEDELEEEEESEEESDMSDTSSDDSVESLHAKERARHHFIIKRDTLTKADYEAYAASRISAFVRGYQSRKFFFEHKCWKEDEKEALEAIEIGQRDLKQAKAAQVFYKKVASMTRPQYRNFAATMIQSHWRGFSAKKNYKQKRRSWLIWIDLNNFPEHKDWSTTLVRYRFEAMWNAYWNPRNQSLIINRSE